MKKTILIIILLLSINLTFSAVEFEEIYNKEVPNHSRIEADGKQFAVYAIDMTRAKIDFPGGTGHIMRPGECTFEYPYNVCFVSIRQGDDSEFNISAQAYPLYPTIKIQKKTADIEMTRTFEKTELHRGDTAKVNVLIKNTGSEAVTNLEYIDRFPNQIEVTDTYDCWKEFNTVKWEGNLNMNQEKSFYFHIKGLDKVEYKSNATLFYGSINITLSETIDVLASDLRIQTNLSADTLNLGDIFNITVSFSNSNPESSASGLRYRLYIPSSLEILTQDNSVNKVSNYYLYTTDLDPLDNRTLSFRLRAINTGRVLIEESADYSINNMQERYRNSHSINITAKNLSVILNRKSEYPPNEHVNIPITISNPNKNAAFKNVELEISSELFETKKVLFSFVKPYSQSPATELSFKIPSENNRIYHISVKMTYESAFGERFKIMQNAEIKAQDAAAASSIALDNATQNLNQSSASVNVTQLNGHLSNNSHKSAFNIADQLEKLVSDKTTFLRIIFGMLFMMVLIFAVAIVFIIKRQRKVRELQEQVYEIRNPTDEKI